MGEGITRVPTAAVYLILNLQTDGRSRCTRVAIARQVEVKVHIKVCNNMNQHDMHLPTVCVGVLYVSVCVSVHDDVWCVCVSECAYNVGE